MSGVEAVVLTVVLGAASSITAIIIAGNIERRYHAKRLYVHFLHVQDAILLRQLDCPRHSLQMHLIRTFSFKRARLKLTLTRHPPERGHKRNKLRGRLGLKEKDYPRREAIDQANPDCLDAGCPHPQHALNFQTPPIPENAAPIFSQPAQQPVIQITPEAIKELLHGLGFRYPVHHGPGSGTWAGASPAGSPFHSPPYVLLL